MASQNFLHCGSMQVAQSRCLQGASSALEKRPGLLDGPSIPPQCVMGLEAHEKESSEHAAVRIRSYWHVAGCPTELVLHSD